jgi:hypothetical protein
MTSTVHPGRYDPESSQADAESVPPRHAALMGATAKLRPSRIKGFPLETALLVLGGLLLPIGVITIIIGWYGASHTPKLYEQNDYLISGGLLGLGLVFMGGFLYFGYWMTRQIRTTNTATQQTLRALSRIEAQLGAGPRSTNGTSNGYKPVEDDQAAEREPVPAPSGSRGRRRGGAEAAVTSRPESKARTATATPQVVATERGTLLHRPDCPVVANKENLRTMDADTPGFRPCQICNPLDD